MIAEVAARRLIHWLTLVLLIASPGTAATITLQNEVLTDPTQGTIATGIADNDIPAAMLTADPADYPIRILSLEILTANSSGMPAQRVFDIQMFDHRPISNINEIARRSDPDWTVNNVSLEANTFTSIDVSGLGIVIPCGLFTVGVKADSAGGAGDPQVVSDLTGCDNLSDTFYDTNVGLWQIPCAAGLPGSFAIRAVVETNVTLPPATGEAQSRVRIDSLPGTLGQFFGIASRGIGDLDGDGLQEVAVGASGDTEGGSDGAVWILFLNANGTVRTQQKINNVHGGLTIFPTSGARFGQSVAGLGDVDGDGIPDIAVGGPRDDGVTPPPPFNEEHGAVWILFLNADGTVKNDVKLDSDNGINFLTGAGRFGQSVSGVGDLDGNGVPDLVVGAPGYGPTPPFFDINHGSLHVLLLNSSGGVLTQQWVRSNFGGFTYTLEKNDLFGSSMDRISDVNGDGRDDLWVGAPFLSNFQIASGAAFLLRLADNGRVSSWSRHEIGQRPDDGATTDLAVVSDLDGSGGNTLVSVTSHDPCNIDGNTDSGSIFVQLHASNHVPLSTVLLNEVEGELSLPPGEEPDYTSCGSIGDLNGDGIPDIVLGNSGDQFIDIVFLERCSPVNLTGFSPQSAIAVGGATITLTGTGFTSVPDTTVLFGNATGTVVSVTPTEIEVLAPAQPSGTNKVNVVVTNSNGSCRLAEGFLYTPCPTISISSVNPSTGFEPGGETVLINGSNLDLGGNVQVFFGANQATIVNESPSQLTVLTPAGVGTVDVRVENGCGSRTRTNGFAYEPCEPTLGSFTPLSGREPGGITVTLTGTNFDYDAGPPTVTFDGTPATIVTFTSTSIEVVNPPGTGQAIVAVSTSCGSDEATARFTYNPCNPVTITLVEPNTGAESGDTHLTVRGSGFPQDEVLEVLFGGTPATILRRQGSRIVVRTPPGAGVVDVTVSNHCDTVSLPGGFTYFPDEIASRFGNVNVDDGDRADVLTINGSAGDADRVVEINVMEPIAMDIAAPPSRSVSKYAVWAFAGVPSSGSTFAAPFDLGLFAFAPPFGGGTPLVIWNTIGSRPLLGFPDFSSSDAPTNLFSHPGLNNPTCVTFQGLIRDDEARIPEGFSVTNAVVLKIR